jgi:ketosteroid isomerase-like protein
LTLARRSETVSGASRRDRVSPTQDLETGFVAATEIETFWVGIKAFNDRDIEGFLATMDEQVEWVPLRSAIEGPYHGHAGIKEWWADTADNWAEFRLDVDEVTQVREGLVIATGTIHARGKEGGVALDIPTSWLMRSANRLATFVEFFFEKKEAARVAGV